MYIKLMSKKHGPLVLVHKACRKQTAPRIYNTEVFCHRCADKLEKVLKYRGEKCSLYFYRVPLKSQSKIKNKVVSSFDKRNIGILSEMTINIQNSVFVKA